MVLYLWFKIKLCQKHVNPLSLFQEHLFLLVSCREDLSLRFAARGTFVLHRVFSHGFALIAHFLVFSQLFLRNNCSLFSCYFFSWEIKESLDRAYNLNNMYVIYGRLASNSNLHKTVFASSDWLVPLLLYRPLLNETNERALLNAFSSSGLEK